MTSMNRSSVLPRESKINANTTDHLSDLEVLGDISAAGGDCSALFGKSGARSEYETRFNSQLSRLVLKLATLSFAATS